MTTPDGMNFLFIQKFSIGRCLAGYLVGSLAGRFAGFLAECLVGCLTPPQRGETLRSDCTVRTLYLYVTLRTN